jgi:hypothetical protein
LVEIESPPDLAESAASNEITMGSSE